MDDVKVSVCMVTYNQERYIAQAVRSVLAQQVNFPYEIVIGEDCSTDSTRAILVDLEKRHPDKIRLRLAERNQGGKANFMATYAACRGQYVAMLEGDDYWTNPLKLQTQVDALEARPDWAICFHPTHCIYEDGMQGQDVYPLNWVRKEATIEDLLEANFIPTNSAVFRNRLFGELPTWFGELVLGDWPLHILNAAHGTIGFFPEIMSAYRVHRAGVWSGEKPVARMIAIFQMFNAIDRHFDGKYAAAIEHYRHQAVREVMSELDSAKLIAANYLEQAQWLDSERSRLLAYSDQMTAEMASLSSSYRVLAEDHEKLQKFYDSWRKSPAYRVARKVRSIGRMMGFWQHSCNVEEQSQPPRTDSIPSSKAA